MVTTESKNHTKLTTKFIWPINFETSILTFFSVQILCINRSFDRVKNNSRTKNNRILQDLHQGRHRARPGITRFFSGVNSGSRSTFQIFTGKPAGGGPGKTPGWNLNFKFFFAKYRDFTGCKLVFHYFFQKYRVFLRVWIEFFKNMPRNTGVFSGCKLQFSFFNQFCYIFHFTPTKIGQS